MFQIVWFLMFFRLVSCDILGKLQLPSSTHGFSGIVDSWRTIDENDTLFVLDTGEEHNLVIYSFDSNTRIVNMKILSLKWSSESRNLDISYDCRLSHRNGSLFIACLKRNSSLDFFISKVSLLQSIAIVGDHIYRLLDENQTNYYLRDFKTGSDSTFLFQLDFCDDVSYGEFLKKNAVPLKIFTLSFLLYSVRSDGNLRWNKLIQRGGTVSIDPMNNQIIINSFEKKRFIAFEYNSGNETKWSYSCPRCAEMKVDAQGLIFFLDQTYELQSFDIKTNMTKKFDICSGKNCFIHITVDYQIVIEWSAYLPLLEKPALKSTIGLEKIASNFRISNLWNFTVSSTESFRFIAGKNVGFASTLNGPSSRVLLIIDMQNLEELPSSQSEPVTSARTQTVSSYGHKPSGLPQLQSDDTIIIAMTVIGAVVAVLSIMALIIMSLRHFTRQKYFIPAPDKDSSIAHLTQSSICTSTSVTMVQSEKPLSVPGYLEINLESELNIQKQLLETSNCRLCLAKITSNQLLQRVKVEQCVVKYSKNASEKSFLYEVSILSYFSGNQYFAQIVGYMTKERALCMEYYPLGPLSRWVRMKTDTQPPYNPSVIHSFAVDILTALAYMHQQGFVHADIKPDNILLKQMDASSYRCILTDFGSTKVVDSKSLLVSSFFVKQAVEATPAYAPPEILEQILKNEASSTAEISAQEIKSIDVYSFGMVLHEMLFQDAPYAPERDAIKIMNMVVVGTRPPCSKKRLKQVRSDPVLDRLFRTVSLCCQKNPKLRPLATSLLRLFENHVANSSVKFNR